MTLRLGRWCSPSGDPRSTTRPLPSKNLSHRRVETTFRYRRQAARLRFRKPGSFEPGFALGVLGHLRMLPFFFGECPHVSQPFFRE
jgi:hypothetical protein